MLGLSERLQALPDPEQQAALLPLLYQAQANDAYWHGLFGGLYLPHLRRALYHAMVKLEQRLDQLSERSECEQRDFDCDGKDELFLHMPNCKPFCAWMDMPLWWNWMPMPCRIILATPWRASKSTTTVSCS